MTTPLGQWSHWMAPAGPQPRAESFPGVRKRCTPHIVHWPRPHLPASKPGAVSGGACSPLEKKPGSGCGGQHPVGAAKTPNTPQESDRKQHRPSLPHPPWPWWSWVVRSCPPTGSVIPGPSWALGRTSQLAQSGHRGTVGQAGLRGCHQEASLVLPRYSSAPQSCWAWGGPHGGTGRTSSK